MVITGAAEGIMKAGNVGAGADASFGVNILLPFEQAANPIIGDDPKLITFKYFFTRKLFFVMEASAVALFPGGFGTHDEGFETLTLIQTGKAPPMPLLFMELPGENYWESFDRFIREQLLGRKLIAERDLLLYKIVHSAEEALDYIKFFYSTYHSLRFVRDRVVIRLEHELPDDVVHDARATSSRTSSRREPWRRRGALPEEANEPELLDKPRLVFALNRQSPSRLYEMMLRINEVGKELNALACQDFANVVSKPPRRRSPMNWMVASKTRRVRIDLPGADQILNVGAAHGVHGIRSHREKRQTSGRSRRCLPRADPSSRAPSSRSSNPRRRRPRSPRSARSDSRRSRTRRARGRRANSTA